MLVMFTSLYRDSNQCYVETTNIDGETNLKLRESPSVVKTNLITSDDGIPKKEMFSGSIEIEIPNKNIHNFVGALKLNNFYDPVPLSAENLLLKGSLLSNVDWIYGIALYTGQQTKIQMNNRHAPSKMSTIEKYVNSAIIIIFIAQVCDAM